MFLDTPAPPTRSVRRCTLALLALGLASCGENPAPSVAQPNVLLVVIDTLRADHLHLYGYPRRTSDHLDTLAATGWTFENHISSSAQTVPSTLSLLLSMQPAEHGFLHLRDTHFARNRPQYPDSLVFLSEIFQAAGYRTGGFVGNPFLQEENGFSQGFERFVYFKGLGETLTEAFLTWLTEPDPGQRPFFAYLHYFDVHSPYAPPRSYADLFERPAGGKALNRNGLAPRVKKADLLASIALYDGEIAYIDDQIGKLIAALERLGIREETLIVVTSDHGEEFLDHGGLGHGTSVYGELVRAPLIVSGPGIEPPGRRVEPLSHHLDVAPTLLGLAGLAAPPSFRGDSLTRPTPRAFTEDGPWLGVYADGHKLILDRRTNFVKTFALDDALDQQPLDDPAVSRQLLEYARWYGRLERAEEARPPDPGGGTPAPPTWSEGEIEHLKALGYAE